MEPFAVYNQNITGPVHAQTVTDLACRCALSSPGVAHLTIATDTQMMKLAEDKHSKKGAQLSGSSVSATKIELPLPEDLARAAEVINQGTKIMILAGRGALGAGDEVLAMAARLKAPVTKALLGKCLLPDDSSYTTGGTGHLGTLPSIKGMETCDTLIILGSNMPWLEYYPQSAKAIQVDRDPKRIGLRYPVTMGLHGDVKATLTALLPLLKQRSDTSFLETAQQGMKIWRAAMSKMESDSSVPIKPQRLAAEVSRLLKPDAVMAIDTGAHTVFTARHWQAQEQQKLAVCGNLASMAPGLPYALAAQIAFPGRQCVAMVGDGSFTMLMAEVATAVLYQLPVKIVIFKNNSLAMDRFEQEELGNPDYGIALQPIDFVKIAEACGAEGYSCKTPGELAGTLKRAFQSAKPAVIEVDVDPNENPKAPDKFNI